MDKICLVIFILAAVEELAFCWPLRFYPFPYYYQNEDYDGEYFNEIIKRSPALPCENSLPRAGYHDTPAISSLQSYQHSPYFSASDDLVSVFVPDNPQKNSIHNGIPNVWYYQPSYSNDIPSSNLVFPSATLGTSTRSHNIGFTRKPSSRIPAVTDSFGMMKPNSQSYSRKNSTFLPFSTTVRTSAPSNNIGFTRKTTNENFPSVTDSAKVMDWDTINGQERKETSSQANSLGSTRSDFMTKRWSWIIPVTSTDSISDEIPISKWSILNSTGTNSIPSLTTPQINVDWRQLGNDNETEVTEYEKFTTNSITEGSIARNQFFSDSGNETDVKVSSDMTTTPYFIETSTSKNLAIDVTERNSSKSDLNTASTIPRSDPPSTEVFSKVEADEFRQSILNFNVDEATLVSEKNNINQTIVESDRLYTTVIVKMTSVSENRTDFSTDSYVTEAPFKVEADDFRLFTSSVNDETTQVSERVIDRTILESERLETAEVNKITTVSGNETNFSMNFVEMEEFIAGLNGTDETVTKPEESIVDWPVTSDPIDPRLIADLKNLTFDAEESSGAGELEQFRINFGTERNISISDISPLLNKTNGTSNSTFEAIQVSNGYESNVEVSPLSVDMYEPVHVIEFMKSESNDFDTESNINAVDCKEFMFSIITPKSGSIETRSSSPSTRIDNLKKPTSRST